MRGVEVPTELIGGDVDEGYGRVAEAFRRNFVERGEVGAACTVYRDGRKVVDLWGGFRDGEARTPWQADTVVLVFSSSKGMASAAVALAHSRGLFELDAPVAVYWPEFAQGGKQRITVRQLLAHQAGVAVLDEKITLEQLAGTRTSSRRCLRRSVPRGSPAPGTATTPSRWAGISRS
jgi:CubicO group peptidase (beta-lactamase class C family)